MTTASRRITSTILWCSLYTYPCPEIQPNAMQSNLLIAPLCYFRLRDVIMMKMLTSAREERISLVAMEPGYSLIKNVDLLNDILKQVKHIWNLFQWYSDNKCVDPYNRIPDPVPVVGSNKRFTSWVGRASLLCKECWFRHRSTSPDIARGSYFLEQRQQWCSMHKHLLFFFYQEFGI